MTSLNDGVLETATFRDPLFEIRGNGGNGGNRVTWPKKKGAGLVSPPLLLLTQPIAYHPHRLPTGGPAAHRKPLPSRRQSLRRCVGWSLHHRGVDEESSTTLPAPI